MASLFEVDCIVAVVSILLEVFSMGDFLAGFIMFALVVPFGVAVAISLDAFTVVLLLDTVVVVFVVCTVVPFVNILVVRPL